MDTTACTEAGRHVLATRHTATECPEEEAQYSAFNYSKGTFVGTKAEVMAFMNETEEYEFEIAMQNGWINAN